MNVRTLSVLGMLLIMPAGAMAQPVLVVNPQSFSLQGAVGTDLAAQAVQVSNGGNRALKWSAMTPTVGWFAVAPAKGVNGGTITLTFTTAALAAGSYQGSFEIQSNGGTSAVVVDVNMVDAPPPPPPPTGIYGPQSTITCPIGAVDVFPGTSIQTVVDAYGGGTTFCLRAGTYAITSAVTPKTGDTFVGEYGAILDGTGWVTTDPNQGAFRAHNQDIDSVTIRNIFFRNMPQRAVHAFQWMSDFWTVEYVEISGCQTALNVPNSFVVRNSYIHHNSGGGYSAYQATGGLFDTNEFAYNGGEQKMVGTTNVTFRNNFVHNNVSDGIWYDGDNTGVLIEGNTVEDNGREGIFHEISGSATIRNNIVRRSGDTGIFISASQNTEIYGNTLEDNFRGIQFFLDCSRVSATHDLTNDYAHDNTIRVGTQAGAWANTLGFLSTCTAAQEEPYLNGSKNLRYEANAYQVPVLGARYWQWGVLKYWEEWQALGQDLTGTVVQR